MNLLSNQSSILTPEKASEFLRKETEEMRVRLFATKDGDFLDASIAFSIELHNYIKNAHGDTDFLLTFIPKHEPHIAEDFLDNNFEWEIREEKKLDSDYFIKPHVVDTCLDILGQYFILMPNEERKNKIFRFLIKHNFQVVWNASSSYDDPSDYESFLGSPLLSEHKSFSSLVGFGKITNFCKTHNMLSDYEHNPNGRLKEILESFITHHIKYAIHQNGNQPAIVGILQLYHEHFLHNDPKAISLFYLNMDQNIAKDEFCATHYEKFKLSLAIPVATPHSSLEEQALDSGSSLKPPTKTLKI